MHIHSPKFLSSAPLLLLRQLSETEEVLSSSSFSLKSILVFPGIFPRLARPVLLLFQTWIYNSMPHFPTHIYGFLLLPVPHDPSLAPFLLQDKVLPSQGEQMVPEPSTISDTPRLETLARPQPLGLFHHLWICVQFPLSPGIRLRLGMNLDFSKQVFCWSSWIFCEQGFELPQFPPCGFPASSPVSNPPRAVPATAPLFMPWACGSLCPSLIKCGIAAMEEQDSTCLGSALGGL